MKLRWWLVETWRCVSLALIFVRRSSAGSVTSLVFSVTPAFRLVVDRMTGAAGRFEAGLLAVAPCGTGRSGG